MLTAQYIGVACSSLYFVFSAVLIPLGIGIDLRSQVVADPTTGMAQLTDGSLSDASFREVLDESASGVAGGGMVGQGGRTVAAELFADPAHVDDPAEQWRKEQSMHTFSAGTWPAHERRNVLGPLHVLRAAT